MDQDNDKIEPITFFEFSVGMRQARHNKENPDHRCECKSIPEMIEKHFEMHKSDHFYINGCTCDFCKGNKK